MILNFLKLSSNSYYSKNLIFKSYKENPMMAIKNNFLLLVTVFVLLYCIATLFQFGLFLSSHSVLKFNQSSSVDKAGAVMVNNSVSSSGSEKMQLSDVYSNLIYDACLLLMFALQHSLQKCKKLKEFLLGLGLASFERLFYNFGSCLALQILMAFWRSATSWTIWEVSTVDKNYVWWCFTCIHSLAWLLMYSGCFIMDITELLGIKQVYHSLQNWPEPLDLKSEGLRRFYSHMRHPCFSSLTVILLIHPVMKIDRLFLAFGLIIYMLLFLKVDDADYAYQGRLFSRKKRDLQAEN